MPSDPPRVRARSYPALFCGLIVLTALAGISTQAQSRREVVVSAHKYGYTVTGSSTPEIRVQQDDLVHVTFSADDIPHSFTTIEDDPHYRINRRAEPGKPVSFDFRADKPGKFAIKCTLAIDERCRELAAWLIVEAKPKSRR